MRHRTIAVLAALCIVPAALLHCGGDEVATGGAGTDASTDTGTTKNDASTGTTDGGTQITPDGSPQIDGSSNGDAGLDASFDAAKYCDLGVAVGDALGGNATLFFQNGGALPPGHYRLSYVNGCMKYGGGQPWTVHAYQPSEAGAPAYATWFVTQDDGGTGFQPIVLPGDWIFGPGATPVDASADDTQQFVDCVAQSKLYPPTEFDYDAGIGLGIQLDDSPLGDNTAGIDGGNPSWRLEVFSQSGICP